MGYRSQLYRYDEQGLRLVGNEKPDAARIRNGIFPVHSSAVNKLHSYAAMGIILLSLRHTAIAVKFKCDFPLIMELLCNVDLLQSA